MPRPSFLMEFVEMNLLEFLNRRNKAPINLIATVDMMLEMGLGMEYLYGQGVVHRDLKSPNILATPSRYPSLQSLGYVELKLTDFGLAKVNVHDVVIPTRKMMGTTLWMAPEAENPREGHTIDWRLADTFSFAMTCSEILTLRQPTTGRERPVLPNECPNYLKEFLEKCWAENPKWRPYFKEIVPILKTFKKHLLLGTEPVQSPSTHTFNFNFASLRDFATKSMQNFAEVLNTLRVGVLDQAELEQFNASVARRLDFAQSVLNNMDELRRQVKVCPTQCGYLVDECKKGLKQVILTYRNLDAPIIMDRFRANDREPHGIVGSLDGLICSLMAAEELFGVCSGPELKTVALALST